MPESAHLRIPDLIAVFVYLAAVVGLGAWAGKRSRTTEGYFLGGRKVPGWAVGLSMLGTAISSITFLAYPGSAYEGNWSRIVPGLMLPFAAVLSIWLFVPFYRKTHLTSAYEYFERRFGNWGRTYACIAFTVFSASRMGLILYLLSLATGQLTGWELSPPLAGWELPMIIVLLGVIVTVYTVVGGIEAVIWTDVLQTIVLLLGGLITVAIVFLTVDGGAAEVIRQAMADGKMSLRDSKIAAGQYFDFRLVAVTFWVLALNGLELNVREMCTDQTKVQRYLAAKSLRSARTAVWITGLGCIPIWALFMFVGTCLYVFYGAHPGALPAGTEVDKVFPRFILTEIPPGLGGLIIAALMAAAMSSIDSSMNGTATVLTEDIYKRHLVKGRDDRHYLVAARALTTLAGVFMILGALLFAYIIDNVKAGDPDIRKTAVDVGFTLAAIFTGGLGGFFLLGFLTRRANSRGAAVGIVVGLLVIVWFTCMKLESAGTVTFLLPLTEPLRDCLEQLRAATPSSYLARVGAYCVDVVLNAHPFLIGVLGNIVVFVVGYGVSWCFARPAEEKIEQLTWRT